MFNFIKKNSALVISLLSFFFFMGSFYSFAMKMESYKQEKAEKEFWSQPTFSFKPTSCRDGRNGEDCNIFLAKGVAAYLLNSQMQRVYVEGELGFIKPRPVKLVFEHGIKGKTIANIPARYKLVSCFCNQPECLIVSPDSPIYLTNNRVLNGYSITKIKHIE